MAFATAIHNSSTSLLVIIFVVFLKLDIVCGKFAHDRIFHGDDIGISEAPFQAIFNAILSTGKYSTCGAVIISAKTFLTAAHCVLPKKIVVANKIIVGTSTRSEGTTFLVKTVFQHPHYID